MNLSCEISYTNESNPFNSSAYNNTEDVKTDLAVNAISFLISFPLNSYVIWLIVRGTGNGLVAEFFILNFSVCEIFYCIECVVVLFAYTFEILWGALFFMDGFPVMGRSLFETLICVERYLAVVHPVTFLKFKPLRYRLMCSAVIWIMCFCSCILNFMLWFFSIIHLDLFFYLVPFLVFLSIQLFCCVAVLRVLKQSGPGERGREREEENHMKKRAFYLILIAIVNIFVIYALQIALLLVDMNSKPSDIIAPISNICFLFAGLVQPLLFLYRVGKLNFIKERMKS